MVIIRLTGGLGNQMFQYAAARALSLRLQVPLRLDISFYSSTANQMLKREFQLCHYRISSDIITTEELQLLKREKSGLMARAWSKLRGSQLKYYYEKKGIDIALFEQLSAPVYLDGIFQSERFFAKYAGEILRDFTLKNQLQNKVNVEF